jgi:integrase
MGINTGLRINDLLSLSVGDVTDKDGKVIETISLKEHKTKKQNRLPVNESLKKALSGYLFEHPNREPSAPLFFSQKGGALSRSQAWRVIKAAGEAAGLGNIGTHSLRKTFGYYAYKKSGSDLGLVQKMLNHSEAGVTLRYIGIDRERINHVCKGMNL